MQNKRIIYLGTALLVVFILLFISSLFTTSPKPLSHEEKPAVKKSEQADTFFNNNSQVKMLPNRIVDSTTKDTDKLKSVEAVDSEVDSHNLIFSSSFVKETPPDILEAVEAEKNQNTSKIENPIQKQNNIATLEERTARVGETTANVDNNIAKVKMSAKPVEVKTETSLADADNNAVEASVKDTLTEVKKDTRLIKAEKELAVEKVTEASKETDSVKMESLAVESVTAKPAKVEADTKLSKMIDSTVKNIDEETESTPIEPRLKEEKKPNIVVEVPRTSRRYVYPLPEAEKSPKLSAEKSPKTVSAPLEISSTSLSYEKTEQEIAEEPVESTIIEEPENPVKATTAKVAEQAVNTTAEKIIEETVESTTEKVAEKRTESTIIKEVEQVSVEKNSETSKISKISETSETSTNVFSEVSPKSVSTLIEASLEQTSTENIKEKKSVVGQNLIVRRTGLTDNAQKNIVTYTILRLDGVTTDFAFECNKNTHVTQFVLSNPPRVVVDIKGDWRIKLPVIPENTRLKNIRSSNSKERTRLVFDLYISPKKVDMQKLNPTSYRIVMQ